MLLIALLLFVSHTTKGLKESETGELVRPEVTGLEFYTQPHAVKKYTNADCIDGDEKSVADQNTANDCAIACVKKYKNTKWLSYGNKQACHCEISSTCLNRKEQSNYDVYEVEFPGQQWSLKFNNFYCTDGTYDAMGRKTNAQECGSACLAKYPKSKYISYSDSGGDSDANCYCKSTQTCSTKRADTTWMVWYKNPKAPAPLPPSTGPNVYGNGLSRGLVAAAKKYVLGVSNQSFSFKTLVKGCWHTVLDGAKCGWKLIKNGAKCGWDLVKVAVSYAGNAAKCGWESLTRWKCVKKFWGRCIFGYPAIFSKAPKSCTQWESVKKAKSCNQATKCAIRTSDCVAQASHLGVGVMKFFNGAIPEALVKLLEIAGKVLDVAIQSIWNILKNLYGWLKDKVESWTFVKVAEAAAKKSKTCFKENDLTPDKWTFAVSKAAETDGAVVPDVAGIAAAGKCIGAAALKALYENSIVGSTVSRVQLAWKKSPALLISLSRGATLVLGGALSLDFAFEIKHPFNKIYVSLTVCGSVKTDISVHAGASINIFRKLTDIPGTALTLNVGVDIGIIAACGGGLGVAWNVPDMEQIAFGFDIGCALNISPIDLEASICHNFQLNGLKAKSPLLISERLKNAQAQVSGMEVYWRSTVPNEPINDKVTVVEPTIIPVKTIEVERTHINAEEIDGLAYAYVNAEDVPTMTGLESMVEEKVVPGAGIETSQTQSVCSENEKKIKEALPEIKKQVDAYKGGCDSAVSRWIECQESNREFQNCYLDQYILMSCGKIKPDWETFQKEVHNCQYEEILQQITDSLDELEKQRGKQVKISKQELCSCANQPGVSPTCSIKILKYCHQHENLESCNRIKGSNFRKCVRRECEQKMKKDPSLKNQEDCEEKTNATDECLEKPFRSYCGQPETLGTFQHETAKMADMLSSQYQMTKSGVAGAGIFALSFGVYLISRSRKHNQELEYENLTNGEDLM